MGTGEILRAGNLFFQVCRDRLYVFDSGRFSWNLFLNCDSDFAFYFERELYFSLTRKTVFSKKTALSCIFFRISIDNLGPYMCYGINISYTELYFINTFFLYKNSVRLFEAYASIIIIFISGVEPHSIATLFSLKIIYYSSKQARLACVFLIP